MNDRSSPRLRRSGYAHPGCLETLFALYEPASSLLAAEHGARVDRLPGGIIEGVVVVNVGVEPDGADNSLA